MRLTSVVLLMVLVAAPAGAAPKKDEFALGDLVDIPRFFRELQKMEDLRIESRKTMVTLHNLTMELAEQPEAAKEKEIRGQIHELLLELRRLKVAQIEKVKPILKRKPSDIEDLEALRRLRDTSLGSVDWQDKYFKHCVALIEETANLKLWMSPGKVNHFNGVYLRLPNVTAETVLKHICHGFDLKWIVYGGEIFITKKLGPNEDRFVRYEKKHGKVNYWRDEPDELMKTVGGKRVPQTVFDMDIGLLQQNLLKFFVLEEESRIHQHKLKELKLVKEAVEAGQLQNPDPKYLTMAKKREKHIVHYLRQEMEGAIEVYDIIGRVLGDTVRLKETGGEWRRLLDTPVKDIAWKQMPLDEALQDLGRKVGIPVVAELDLIEVPYITLTIDRGTLETVINMIRDIHPVEAVYRKGKIFFYEQ
jgi:hypothetical protein